MSIFEEKVEVPQCNGICLTGGEIGFPGTGIAYAHPECELHGHWALYEIDGTPRNEAKSMS